MYNTVAQLKRGFESSSGLTPEFDWFYRTFKREFTSELMSVGCTDIVFSRGHFYVSGFFTFNGQPFYFSLPDVRGIADCLEMNPNSCMCQLLYRTARDYKDYSGGRNMYCPIKFGMIDSMVWYMDKELV